MSAPTMRPVPRPVIEVQERRRCRPGPRRGQRRARGPVRSAAIVASYIECGEDW